jgi:CRP-like cAMP-binding protein
MSNYQPRLKTTNRILSRLSRPDLSLLEPRLEAVDLPLRKVLESRNKRVQDIYFIESGFASVVANGSSDGTTIEVGLVGKEGMTGISTVLGADERAETDTFIQSAGSGLCIRAADLHRAIALSPTLQQALLRYVHLFLKQVTRTAVANGRSKIEERLARWLLMASDRVEGELKLTQEFLAMMLGVRRPGVTVALQALERERLITHKRGVITILNRDAMVKRSNGTYPGSDSD